MKTPNKNNGFTLIETLVTINLSFITISLIFSFYLFAQKFSESLSQNYLEKYIQTSFLNALEKTLNNGDGYILRFVDDSIIINTNEEDSILISPNSISINRIFEITNLDSISISISTDIESYLVKWENGTLTNSNFENQTLESNKILSILFEIVVNKKYYSFNHSPISNSTTHFINISNQYLQTSF